MQIRHKCAKTFTLKDCNLKNLFNFYWKIKIIKNREKTRIILTCKVNNDFAMHHHMAQYIIELKY